MTTRSWLVGPLTLLTVIMGAGLGAPALAQNPVKIGVLTPLSPPGGRRICGRGAIRGRAGGAGRSGARI